MPIKYCEKGHINKYDPGHDPKFCSSCGVKFGGIKILSSLIPKAPTKEEPRHEKVEEDDDLEETPVDIDNIQPFDIQVSDIEPRNKYDAQAEFGRLKEATALNFDRTKTPNKNNAEEVLAALKTSKGKSVDVE